VHISDADKGAAAAYEACLEFAQTFICSQHRGETCGGKFGKGSKDFYVKFASARTPAQLRKAKRRMMAHMVKYVEKLSEAMQCKLSHPGKLHGINTSNQAESENNAVMEVRECKDVFYALQRFIEYSQEKHVEHAAKAVATLTRATPVVMLYLAEIQANAVALSRFAWINEDTREGRVYPRAG